MEPAEVLEQLGSTFGADALMGHFAAPRATRADTIQRFWAQPEGRQVAESLIELEIDDATRNVVIHLLRERTSPTSL